MSDRRDEPRDDDPRPARRFTLDEPAAPDLASPRPRLDFDSQLPTRPLEEAPVSRAERDLAASLGKPRKRRWGCSACSVGASRWARPKWPCNCPRLCSVEIGSAAAGTCWGWVPSPWVPGHCCARPGACAG
ncbi:hypothetical protein [Billgrantia tianxiuensis]|uniref:hypothetical protein n=1 Tax=Billgrantia tianxiuensis TaxID=2497861 RepID=UPI0030EBA090